MDEATAVPTIYSDEPFIAAENEEWVIVLAPIPAKCAWLTFDMFLKGDPSVSYRIAFNHVYRRTDNGPDWQRLIDERPDSVSWFFDTISLRFPFCQVCKEMFEKDGCVFDDE